MSLLVWNCQGLGNLWTVKELRDLLRANNPHLVFLAETKCSSSQIENLKRKLDLFGYCVESREKSGSLALLWQKSVEVQLQSFSKYHVDASVRTEESEECWRFTGVYGEPDASKRSEFWHLLCRLSQQSVRPWLCAGDFNEILEHSEKKGGPMRAEWQIRNFRNCLVDCGLNDLGFSGAAHTWCNNHQTPHTIRERLDRACSSSSWSSLFLEARVLHLESPYSDHAPLIIELRPKMKWDLSGCRKRFRFEAVWIQESECEATVTNAWLAPDSPQPECRLREKLASVSARLSCWGRSFGREVGERLTELERLKKFFGNNVAKICGQKKGTVIPVFSMLKQAMDIRLIQFCDCVLLMVLGLSQWKGGEGWCLEYFEGVFTSSRPSPDDIRSGTEHLQPVVSSEMADSLLRPYTEMESLSQYRPISLCNVEGLDNVLVAFETNHFLHTHSKGRKHFMNLKLDISKAYDRVEWSFLRKVMESLCSLFRAAADRGTIPGVAVCRGAPSISHLLFPDDTMVFCPATLSTVQAVRLVLDTYKLASGQKINLHKSSAVFSRNTPRDTRQNLVTVLGIRLENKHEVYLGLPALAYRFKKALFAALKDRIWKRVQGWQEKSLSQAGKTILIQAVVQAIPSYAMSYFKLPKSLLQEFQALAANFFWHDGDRQRIHWLAWDQMCSSKLEGGLGFRNLEAFNLALLAKQLWRLLTRPESLVYQVLKAKYFPHSHLFDATLGSRPSYTWRSIFTAMNLFRSGCRWRIGTGHSVNIWEDPWIPRTPSFRVITPQPLNILASQVSELIDADLRVWNESLVNSLFSPEDRDLILQIPLRLVGSTDLLVWHYSRNGLFSVRSAYHLALACARPASSNEIRWSRQLWSKIWQAHMPNKAKVFSWQAIRNILPTASNLHKRMPQEYSIVLCARKRWKLLSTPSFAAPSLDRFGHSPTFNGVASILLY
ncbi:UNVERIFIED_CONTAM: putative mitochondrial protein [Sesamum calycinum]|uniref:Mitochondrial protein n=1 Tax=Sesamum calycinum TaxID=2727403 RepID=A0AAW2ISI3_9LAMI